MKSQQSSSKKAGWLKPFSNVFFLTVAVPLVATACISGKSATEKMLTDMAQPFFVALVVVLSVGWVLTLRQEKVIGRLLIAGSILLWILACPFFSQQIYTFWEAELPPNPEITEPFDYVIVLGGGTSRAPDGRPQFSEAGDRVGYGAQLFLSGKTKHLITTGEALKLSGSLSGSFSSKDNGSEQTHEIWRNLGIPEDAILQVGGENTRAEIAAIQSHPEWWKNKRCAILTSAFHLPRAMRLAQQAGLTVSPIAADYRSGRGPITVNSFLPSPSQLSRWHFLFKEWLAVKIGR